MRSGLNKNKIITCTEYILVFLVLSAAFFFMIPQSDVFLFARDTNRDFLSVFDHSLNYGNGRLLGNIIGVGLSHYFEIAFLTVALTLVFLIALLNKLLFNNKAYTVIPIALLVVFPSSGMISEAYYVFPAFCNYVMPCVLFLLSFVVLKSVLEENNKKTVSEILSALVLLISGVSSCLFSENTTLIILTFSVLQIFYTFIMRKNVKALQVVYTLSVFLGAAAMFLIPKITGTAQKMDHYRSVEISVSRFLASFVRFSEVICNLSFIMVAVSVALVYLCIKKTKLNLTIKIIQVSFYGLFCFGSFFIRDFETADVYFSRINFVAMVAIGIYLVFAVITVLAVVDKKLRFELMLMIVLLASSVVPMLFVNQYGFRTYYLTAILLLIFALYIIKIGVDESGDFISRIVKAEAAQKTKRISCMCSAGLFVMLGAFLFIQTVYNYDLYVLRTDLIQEQIGSIENLSTDEYIFAFNLPFEGISVEDEFSFNNVMYDILPGRPENMRVVSVSDNLFFEDVRILLEGSFFNALKIAFDNLEYKNPLLLLERISQQ